MILENVDDESLVNVKELRSQQRNVWTYCQQEILLDKNSKEILSEFSRILESLEDGY